MCHVFFIHSSVVGHLDCLHVLAIVNGDIRVHVSFWISFSSGYMLRSGISASYGNSIFSFLRNLHIFFHSGCTSLFWRFTFVHILSKICYFRVLMMAILTGVRWYLVVLIVFL